LKGFAIQGDSAKPKKNQNGPTAAYKQRFEKLIVCWKKAMKMSDYICNIFLSLVKGYSKLFIYSN
jgi:hypothetical protein